MSPLTRLVRAVDQAGIKPVIDSVYPLAELASAFDHLDKWPFGKVMIDVNGDGEV